jgi:polar amino acid transport system permease protein
MASNDSAPQPSGPVTTSPDGPAASDEIPELYRSGRRKQQAARARRITAYVLTAVVVLVVLIKVDWESIGQNYFNGEFIGDQFPKIVTIAAKNTIIYTLAAFVGGVALGVSMALMRMSEIRAFRWFATTYIEIFRGLPALLTIFIVGSYTPGALNFKYPTIFGIESAGIVALSIVAGAYLAETIRAGIQAVPKGQIEAARSLGLTRAQTMRTIILPQAFRIVVPPLTNEVVLLLKDTSLLSVLGVTPMSKELTKFGTSASAEVVNVTPLMVAGLMYLIITIPLTQLVAYLERRGAKTR